MTLQLRDYQRAAVDSVYDYWSREAGSPLIVLPTGGGKSLVIATLMEELLRDYPDMRVLAVAHVKELLTQNFSELLNLWPFAPAGLFSAGLGRRDAHSQIIFGGVQTIYNKAAKIGHVDLVLIDEAHLTPRKTETQYGQLLAGLRAINPDLKMLGLTATPYRLGEGRLDLGEGAMFDAIAYEKPIGEMIDEGYLCRPISKGMRTEYDLSGVHRLGGDYKQNELEAAVDKDEITRAAVDELMAYGANRKCWLVFCSGVKHATHVRDEIRSRGISCEMVAGDTPSQERDRILADFKAGRIRCVTNNAVMTTGLNIPGIDMLALMRKTLSPSLFVQMVGRGLRLSPGKDDCLVLDYGRNAETHGPLDDIQVKEPGKGTGDAPCKLCPNCFSLVAASKRICDDCGHEFEIDDKPKIQRKSDDIGLLKRDREQPRPAPVKGRTFAHHTSKDPTKPDTVKITFWSGLKSYNQWIGPGSQGFMKTKSDRFWSQHGGHRPFPASVKEFLERQGELLSTASVDVKPDGKYWSVESWTPGSPDAANDNWTTELDYAIPF